jgi:hypothetical protein
MAPILVIDDQKGIRSLIATVLKDLGQEDKLAEDGQKGIELLFLDSEPDGERRRLHRKKVTLPATIILKNGSKSQAHPGVILNVSRSGVLLTYARGSDMHFTSRGSSSLQAVLFCVSIPERTLFRLCCPSHAGHWGGNPGWCKLQRPKRGKSSNAGFLSDIGTEDEGHGL